jgi:AAA+ superfamily predicted ATPase
MSQAKFIEGLLGEIEANIERRHQENMQAYYNKVLAIVSEEDLDKLKLKKQALMMSRDIIDEVLKQTLERG